MAVDWIAQLKHEDPRVRRQAAMELGNTGDRSAVAPLVATLQDGDMRVRSSAAEALGHIGDSSAVGPLQRLLTGANTCFSLRITCARALCRVIADSTTVADVLVSLIDLEGPMVEYVGVEGLVAFGSLAIATLMVVCSVGDIRHDGGFYFVCGIALCCYFVTLLAGLGTYVDFRRLHSIKKCITLISDAIDSPVYGCMCQRHHTRIRGWATHFTSTTDPSRYECRMCNGPTVYRHCTQIILLLDSEVTDIERWTGGVLRVNWLLHRELCDFDRVEIVQATDEEVERFDAQVRNDSDEWRRKQYRKMTCSIGPKCHLSENTLRGLRSSFARVGTSSSTLDSRISKDGHYVHTGDSSCPTC